MRTQLAFIAGFSLLMLIVGSPLRADDSDDPKTAHASDGADRVKKELPAKASATAKERAFGQQGERERAAHEAAKAAAIAAARDAADVHAPDATHVIRGRSSVQPANSHAAKGQATAAAARSGTLGASHGR
jgi:hypothetical protein